MSDETDRPNHCAKVPAYLSVVFPATPDFLKSRVWPAIQSECCPVVRCAVPRIVELRPPESGRGTETIDKQISVKLSMNGAVRSSGILQ